LSSDNTRWILVVAGSAVTAFVTLLLALGFLWTGRSLVGTLRSAPSKEGRRLNRKLTIITASFTFLFLLEAVCLVLSAYPKNFEGNYAEAVTATYLACDVACCFMLMYCFSSAVKEAKRKPEKIARLGLDTGDYNGGTGRALSRSRNGTTSSNSPDTDLHLVNGGGGSPSVVDDGATPVGGAASADAASARESFFVSSSGSGDVVELAPTPSPV